MSSLDLARSVGPGGEPRQPFPAPALPGSGSDGRRPLPPSQPIAGSRCESDGSPAQALLGAARDTFGIDAWYDELIREATTSFNERDFSTAARWAHEDAVFDWSRSMADNRGVHHGLEEMERVFERFLEPWASVRWEITGVDELEGDRLLVTTRIRVRGRDSGVETEATGAQLWEFRERKVARATMFQGRDEAARELGLSE